MSIGAATVARSNKEPMKNHADVPESKAFGKQDLRVYGFNGLSPTTGCTVTEFQRVTCPINVME